MPASFSHPARSAAAAQAELDGELSSAEAVSVATLDERDFSLVGGRLDYVAGHAAAVVVYQLRQHPIEVFIWPDPDVENSKPVSQVRNGYIVLRWNQQQTTLSAISDVSATQLQEFVARRVCSPMAKPAVA